LNNKHVIPVKDSPLTWSRLRAIGKSSAARITVLLPLIGYLIIFNKSVADFLHLVSELSGSSEKQLMSVSPKLMLVYLGTCGIALGQVIYGIFCPPEVKGYGHETPYILDADRVTKDFGYEKMEGVLRTSAYSAEYLRMRSRYEHDLGPPITEEQQRHSALVFSMAEQSVVGRKMDKRHVLLGRPNLPRGAVTRGFSAGHENHYRRSTY
jgi:hypothetical protein